MYLFKMPVPRMPVSSPLLQRAMDVIFGLNAFEIGRGGGLQHYRNQQKLIFYPENPIFDPILVEKMWLFGIQVPEKKFYGLPTSHRCCEGYHTAATKNTDFGPENTKAPNMQEYDSLPPYATPITSVPLYL